MKAGKRIKRQEGQDSVDFIAAVRFNPVNPVKMKNFFLEFVAVVVCIYTIVPLSLAQEPKPDKPKQFIYVLHLVPRLYDDANWTKEDKAVLGRHFNRFKDAAASGQLILAGRTSEPGNKTFGIAVFEANDEKAAQKFMNDDPTVIAGIMTAELHPFAVALQREAARN